MIAPLSDPDILEAYNSDALGYRGSPEGLFRPADEAETADILRDCAASGRKLTPTALRSSTTGGCVCHEGFLLATEKLSRVLDIRPEPLTAVAQPGVNLGELKRALEDHGLFFPPDPTSENDCTLGGAVATNASGARALKYGATRRWVRRIRAVLADGRPLELHASSVDKNAAGYFGFQDPLQLFIGSEGTLGVITEVEVRCLPTPADYIAVFAFFPSEADTLRAVTAIRDARWPVRCLEYFDLACLHLLRREKGAELPAHPGGMLFFEEEVAEGGAETALENWLERLEGLGAVVDDTVVGDTRARKQQMRDFRHAVPSGLNEQGIRYRDRGGRKLSTDWAVDYRLLPDVVPAVRAMCAAEGLGEVFCFGHIGNGHPHFNLLAPGETALFAARRAVHAMCRHVCGLGGTISAEHGIGKTKKEFLAYMYPPVVLEWMHAFKRAADPLGILAPGNLFD